MHLHAWSVAVLDGFLSMLLRYSEPELYAWLFMCIWNKVICLPREG